MYSLCSLHVNLGPNIIPQPTRLWQYPRIYNSVIETIGFISGLYSKDLCLRLRNVKGQPVATKPVLKALLHPMQRLQSLIVTTVSSANKVNTAFAPSAISSTNMRKGLVQGPSPAERQNEQGSFLSLLH